MLLVTNAGVLQPRESDELRSRRWLCLRVLSTSLSRIIRLQMNAPFIFLGRSMHVILFSHDLALNRASVGTCISAVSNQSFVFDTLTTELLNLLCSSTEALPMDTSTDKGQQIKSSLYVNIHQIHERSLCDGKLFSPFSSLYVGREHTITSL